MATPKYRGAALQDLPISYYEPKVRRPTAKPQLRVNTKPSKSLATVSFKRPSLAPSATPTTRPPALKRANTLASSTSKASSRKIDTKSLRSDRLGTCVRELTAAFKNCKSWEEFVTTFRGRSYLAEDLQDLPHPAAPILQMWHDKGVPVLSSALPWTMEQKDAAVERGCHPSANVHAPFVRDEMAEFIDNKFWMVQPYDLVKELLIMFTPLAVKDERDRRPRLLMDHSWPWPWGSINELTLPGAPPESMQFGPMLCRLMYYVRHANPLFGPVKTAKHDVKDGYYRLFLSPADCLKLAALLPRYDDEPPLVGIPMSCTMGWAQSPPTFCTMSETVCDLVNEGLRSGYLLRTPTHRLSVAAQAHDDVSPSSEPRPYDDETRLVNEHLEDWKERDPMPSPELGPVPP